MKILFKISVTGIIFYLIFRSIDIHQVLKTVIHIHPAYVALAALSQIISTFIASYRWYDVMRVLGFGRNYAFYLKSYFKGIFFNQGLPTSIGGDAYRVVEVSNLGYRKRDAFYGVAVDRIMGLTGLLILNNIAILFQPPWLPREIVILLNIILLGSLLSIAVMVRVGQSDFCKSRVLLVPLVDLSLNYTAVYRSLKRVVLHVVLSLMAHFFSILALFNVSLSLVLGQDFLTFLILVPPVNLLTLVPISLAGWGVREGALIGLFILTGADKTLILSMSVLYGIMVMATSLIGMFFYLRDKPVSAIAENNAGSQNERD